MSLPEIPSYEIESEIGIGGMGVVYRARHVSLDRIVALKVIHPKFVRDAGFVKGFAQEAKTVARLSHPNIVSIYDFGCHEGVYYLSMEYVHGSTLRDLLFIRRPKWEECASIVNQVAAALDFAHREEVVHRDIKPGNVLLCANGKTMVIDFGVAHASYSNAPDSVWLAAGTRSYMSPEQCKGQWATARSDQYSLGVVVYEMLTGRLPFTASDPLAVMQQHISDIPPPLRTGRTDITPRVEAAVLRSLSKIPEMRFSTTGAFARELETALVEARAMDAPITSPAGAASASASAPSGPRSGPVSLVDGMPAESRSKSSYRIGYLSAVRGVSGKSFRRSARAKLLVLFLVGALGAGGYYVYLDVTGLRAAEQAKQLADKAATAVTAAMSRRQERREKHRARESGRSESTSSSTSSHAAMPSPKGTAVGQAATGTAAPPVDEAATKPAEPATEEDSQPPKVPDAPEGDSGSKE